MVIKGGRKDKMGIKGGRKDKKVKNPCYIVYLLQCKRVYTATHISKLKMYFVIITQHNWTEIIAFRGLFSHGSKLLKSLKFT